MLPTFLKKLALSIGITCMTSSIEIIVVNLFSFSIKRRLKRRSCHFRRFRPKQTHSIYNILLSAYSMEALLVRVNV
jgi:hypothetical protein